MKHTELKQYFPAGGKLANTIEITEVKITSNPDVFVGKAALSPNDTEQMFAIHRLNFETYKEYRAIPAKCPHQGADITQDALKVDGNIYCSLHKRPICVFSEYNNAYLVEKKMEKFYLIKA